MYIFEHYPVVTPYDPHSRFVALLTKKTTALIGGLCLLNASLSAGFSRYEISPSGSGQVFEYMPGRIIGSTYNLHGYQAEPNTAYEFVAWTGGHINETGYTTENPYDHEWEDNQHEFGDFVITANFRLIDPAPYFYIIHSEGGTVSYSNEYTSEISKELNQTYTATPEDGYAFVRWEIYKNNEIRTELDFTHTYNPHLPTTRDLKPIKAIFEETAPSNSFYSIETSTGGSVSVSIERIADTKIREYYTATPQGDFAFSHWRIHEMLIRGRVYMHEYDPTLMYPAVIRPIQPIFRQITPGADLSGSDFSGLNLQNVLFKNNNLSQSDFRQCTFANVEIRINDYPTNKSYLQDADFSGADLSGLRITNGNLEFSGIFASGMVFTNPTPDCEELSQEVADLRAQLELHETNNQLKLSTDEVLDLRANSIGAAMENNILNLEMEIETSESLEEGSWHSLKDSSGNKVKASVGVPIQSTKRFYRIKR